jgi:hypothetical protein
MMTTTNTNDDLVVSRVHALGASVCAGWWLAFNRPRWCYAILVVICVIYSPLQRAALRKLLQRGAMHAHMLCV